MFKQAKMNRAYREAKELEATSPHLGVLRLLALRKKDRVRYDKAAKTQR